ncbi:unnamed protein product [Spirodela intermedia]|uniref:NFD4 C-terminal domain-containing protein n=1 Tax=Spirodela intermedia TaxID=51605 RepID=A0A7I8IIE9_SPIIN|nr:unnamed protein product [Spirodela intermedia]CAA6656935.1 unnamed protein product [Spirodela intermedia]
MWKRGWQRQEHGRSRRGEEVAASAMLRTPEFLLLVYLNNLGQTVESRGNSKTSAVVSLAFAFGFFGRCMVSLMDFVCIR